MTVRADRVKTSGFPRKDATREQGSQSGSGIPGLILKRLAIAPIILLGVTIVVFLVIDLSPNDPAAAKLGVFASPEARAQFIIQNNLDDPLPVRYGRFLLDLFHLNLGESVVTSEPVMDQLARAFPITLQLVVLSTLIAVVLSLAFGTLAARTDGRLPDKTISTVAALFQAAPPFWTGLLFVQLFAVGLGVLPSGGYSGFDTGFVYWFSSLIGPAVVLALPFTAAMTRVIRSSMADELSKDYVRTAVGSGVSVWVVVFRNTLRNALVTPITVLGVYIGTLMSGAVVVELVFNLPGMGSLLITGVRQGDLAIVRGVALVGAVVFVLVNLVVDVLYLLLNPRSAEASLR